MSFIFNPRLHFLSRTTGDFEFSSISTSVSEKAEINTEPRVFTLQIPPPHTHGHTKAVLCSTTCWSLPMKTSLLLLGQFLNSSSVFSSLHRSTFASPLWTLSWSLPSSPAPPASSCLTRYSGRQLSTDLQHQIICHHCHL